MPARPARFGSAFSFVIGFRGDIESNDLAFGDGADTRFDGYMTSVGA